MTIHTDIALTHASSTLPAAYQTMVDRIGARLPAIERDSAAFHKSHSQFMIATLDVTPLTTIRAAKQVLAEIDRTRRALEEAYIADRRRSIDLAEKHEAMHQSPHLGRFDLQRLEVDCLELQSQQAATANAVQGAIRKLAFLTAQHVALMNRLGKDHLTEADYEADEARYHVLTCMKQALCAARARGGIIDEGNQIYLFDMGLPAAEAQKRIRDYLTEELRLVEAGQPVTHEHTMRFLERCANDWAHYPSVNAARRGLLLGDTPSLHVASEG